MRFNTLHSTQALEEEDEQLSLPFDDLGQRPRPPVTYRQVVEVAGRKNQAFELVVHLDPTTLIVLAHCLRPITKH